MLLWLRRRLNLPATGPTALKPKMPKSTGARTGVKAIPTAAPATVPMIRRVAAKCDEKIEHFW